MNDMTAKNMEINEYNNDPHSREDGQWHLDKKVPIAIITALAMQFFGVIWYFSGWSTAIESRLFTLEKTDAAREQHGDRITIMEQGLLGLRSKLDDHKESLNEIKALIRQNGVAK